MFEHYGPHQIGQYIDHLVATDARYHGRHIEKIFPDISTPGAAFADKSLGGVGGVLDGFGGSLDHIHYLAESCTKKRISRKECVDLVKQKRPTVGYHLRLFVDDSDIFGFIVGWNQYGGASAIVDGLRTHPATETTDGSELSIAFYLEHDGVKYSITRLQFSKIVLSFERFGGSGAWVASNLRHSNVVCS